MHNSHFARVVPIVGHSLRRALVALIGLPDGAPMVELLAACGVGRWLWATGESPAGGDVLAPDSGALRSALLARHGEALELDAATLPPQEWATVVQSDRPNLIIAVGDAVTHRHALQTAVAARVPILLIAQPSRAAPCSATVVFSGDDPVAAERWIALCEDAASDRPACALGDGTPVPNWDWATAAPLCAGLARAILLRDTPYARADLAELWEAGIRALTIGARDPLDIAWSRLPTDHTPPANLSPGLRVSRSPCLSVSRSPGLPVFHTPPARRGKLLIAGLGSLGSVAALHLIEHTSTLIIADPDRVDAYNPIRQSYSRAMIGQNKATAMRDTLLAAGANAVIALDRALTDERDVITLIERYNISAALVVTGSAADFAIGRALRACDLPHVVGRCYPRARFWEAIIVDGQRGPALSDLRGHLRLGSAPLPTPEQLAAYSDAGALEAEPATLIESGWAALWMARLVAQLLAPAGLRECWLIELLASERTCLVGGVGIEPTPDGAAYGVALPGMIHAWGRAEIRGAG